MPERSVRTGPAAGVDFAADGGRPSSSRAGRSILAAAARAADPQLAERIAGASQWREQYLTAVGDVTAAGGRSAQAALAIARAGQAALYSALTFTRDGATMPLGEALRVPPSEPARTRTIRGTAPRQRTLAVPYRGEHLEGDALRRRLAEWVAKGVVEPSFALAIERVIAHPDWLALEGRTVALLGAGAAMGPLEPLTRWGADVLAVDVAAPAVAGRLEALATSGAGTVRLPLGRAAAHAGADLTTDLPETAAWIAAEAGEGPLVLGTHVYAHGAKHVHVSAAADALARELLARRPGMALAYLATPTDAYLVGAEVVAAARQRWSGRRIRALAQAPLRAVTRGRTFTPSYAATITGEDGREWGLADALVPQQGPNYALAKRLQRWRALTARDAGHTVSINVAPASWTASVTANRLLAAAYAGAHRFGVEIFAPETARTLMAALLVHDSHADEPAGSHPDELLAAGAAHGGLWRSAYQPRSVLPLAAVTGLPSTLVPRR